MVFVYLYILPILVASLYTVQSYEASCPVILFSWVVLNCSLKMALFGVVLSTITEAHLKISFFGVVLLTIMQTHLRKPLFRLPPFWWTELVGAGLGPWWGGLWCEGVDVIMGEAQVAVHDEDGGTEVSRPVGWHAPLRMLVLTWPHPLPLTQTCSHVACPLYPRTTTCLELPHGSWTATWVQLMPPEPLHVCWITSYPMAFSSRHFLLIFSTLQRSVCL